MGLLDLFKRPDINQGIKNCSSVPGTVLADVRTPQKYREGHSPESGNVPLQEINVAESRLGHRDTPLFLHCYSGAWSTQTASTLRHMGYTNITNIGGIAARKGSVEH